MWSHKLGHSQALQRLLAEFGTLAMMDGVLAWL